MFKGFPVSNRDLRLDRIIGQPLRPPSSRYAGIGVGCASGHGKADNAVTNRRDLVGYGDGLRAISPRSNRHSTRPQACAADRSRAPRRAHPRCRRACGAIHGEPLFQSDSTDRPEKHRVVKALDVSASHNFPRRAGDVDRTYTVLSVVISGPSVLPSSCFLEIAERAQARALVLADPAVGDVMNGDGIEIVQLLSPAL